MQYFFMLLLILAPYENLYAMEWGQLRGAIARQTSRQSEEPNEALQKLLPRLNDMVVMAVTYNRQQRLQEPREALFCPPSGQPFHLQELLNLINEQAKLVQADDSISVQELVLGGFTRQFPCSAP